MAARSNEMIFIFHLAVYKLAAYAHTEGNYRSPAGGRSATRRKTEPRNRRNDQTQTATMAPISSNESSWNPLVIKNSLNGRFS